MLPTNHSLAVLAIQIFCVVLLRMCDIERAIDHEINVPDYLIYLFKRTLSTQTQTLTYAKQARDVTNSYKLSLSDRVGMDSSDEVTCLLEMWWIC